MPTASPAAARAILEPAEQAVTTVVCAALTSTPRRGLVGGRARGHTGAGTLAGAPEPALLSSLPHPVTPAPPITAYFLVIDQRLLKAQSNFI